MRGARADAPAAADHPAAAAAPVADRETDPDLGRLHRRTWCGSVAFVYGLGAFVAIAVASSEPLGPLTVVTVASAALGSIASARLLQHRLRGAASAPPAGDAAQRGLAALAVVGAAAFVVAAQLVGGAETSSDGPASWFAVPGAATGAIAVAWFRRRRLVVVAAGAVAATLLAAATGATGGVTPGWLAVDGALVAAVGVALVSEVHYWELMVRLDRARHAESELAVANERLRFAGELHDVQGHHLQVIALESELAARLADRDPAEAAQHMSEVHEHAQAALADTRAVVRAYRRTSLGGELTNATRVLAAAGVDGRLDAGTREAAEGLVEAGAQLLGLVVREATTNVLRHSRATQARVTLRAADGEVRLEVANDGCGSVPAGPGDGASADSGLPALAQRVSAAGGDLRWQRQGEWFVVTARIPEDGPGAVASGKGRA